MNTGVVTEVMLGMVMKHAVIVKEVILKVGKTVCGKSHQRLLQIHILVTHLKTFFKAPVTHER